MGTKNHELQQKKQFVMDTVAKFCDKCGTQYSLDDFNIVQSFGLATIIHFCCHNCKTQHIATVTNVGASKKTLVNTDLEPNEIGKFINMPKIQPQEVLDLYISLKDTKSVKI